MDRNSDGFISLAEVKTELKIDGMPRARGELSKLFRVLDADEDGRIGHSEFKRHVKSLGQTWAALPATG